MIIAFSILLAAKQAIKKIKEYKLAQEEDKKLYNKNKNIKLNINDKNNNDPINEELYSHIKNLDEILDNFSNQKISGNNELSFKNFENKKTTVDNKVYTKKEKFFKILNKIENFIDNLIILKKNIDKKYNELVK